MSALVPLLSSFCTRKSRRWRNVPSGTSSPWLAPDGLFVSMCIYAISTMSSVLSVIKRSGVTESGKGNDFGVFIFINIIKKDQPWPCVDVKVSPQKCSVQWLVEILQSDDTGKCYCNAVLHKTLCTMGQTAGKIRHQPQCHTSAPLNIYNSNCPLEHTSANKHYHENS